MGRKKIKKLKNNPKREELSEQDRQLFLDALQDFDEWIKFEGGTDPAAKAVNSSEFQGKLPGKAEKKAAQGYKIDLHGLTLIEAKKAIEAEIEQIRGGSRRQNATVKLEIITGKGKRSSQGGVLIKEIYDWFVARFRNYIVTIDENPDKLRLDDGTPLKGAFRSELKF